jgi:hypothetical protein
MSKEVPTPSSVFNSRVRNKMEVNENDKGLISNALSIIWRKTNKKVESCVFERNKVTVCCNKSGRIYFDLVEEYDESVEAKVLFFSFLYYWTILSISCFYTNTKVFLFKYLGILSFP